MRKTAREKPVPWFGTEILETELKHITVARVIDGDTIKMCDSIVLCYLGMDTPERGKWFYKEARAVNDSLVSGKRVGFEFDTLRVGPSIDKYGRTLAYVGIDTFFVNAWLVQYGYARVMTIPPGHHVCTAVSAIGERG